LLGFFAIEGLGNRERRRDHYDAVGLLIFTAVGFAIQIFVLFFLAQMHSFYAYVIAIALSSVLFLAAFFALRKCPLRELLETLVSPLKNACGPAWLFVLGCCCFLSAPAILPPVKYDSIMYHLAYAVEWSRAGGLTVDRFLHFPLAEFNIELLYAMMFSFKLDDYVQFETWTLFCVCATGSVALTIMLLKRMGASRFEASLASIVVSFVYISCPLVVSLMDTAYIDLPAGALLLAFSAAALRAKDDFSRAGLALALIGGCFIGSKISFLPSIILILFLLITRARACRASRRSLIISISLLLVLASPWYLRNAIVAGDPIDPVFNLAVHHSDPFWTSDDLARQKSDLNRSIPFYAVPIWLYMNPIESEGAVSSSFLFFYVVVALGLVLLLNKRFRQSQPDLSLIAGIVIFAMAEQFFESNRFNRYSMPFFALFIILIMMTSWLSSRWLSKALFKLESWQLQLSSILVILLMALPPPVAFNEYHDLDYQYQMLGTALKFPQFYLGGLAGYQVASNLADFVASSGSSENVLDVDFQDLQYFFRRKGVVAIGDWWGPGRYSDLQSAINDDRVADYLEHLSVGAIMFGRDIKFLGDSVTRFAAEIKKAGFLEVSNPEADSRVFIRPQLISEAKAHGDLWDMSPFSSSKLYLESIFGNATVYDANGIAKDKSVASSSFIFPVLNGGKSVNAVTVTARNEVRFPVILTSPNSKLTADVGKIFSAGSPAIAWIDLQVGQKRRRIFSETVPVAVGREPIWQNVSIPVRSTSPRLNVILGASSVAGGGMADWVAFAHPILTDAKPAEPEPTVTVQPTLSSATAAPVAAPVVARVGAPLLHFVTKDEGAGVLFIADPNPAAVSPNNGMAVVTVKWSVPGASEVEVHMARPDGQLFAAGPSNGSATTGPWVQHSATFYLQDVTGGRPGNTAAILRAE
jgi:hypothetical protein